MAHATTTPTAAHSAPQRFQSPTTTPVRPTAHLDSVAIARHQHAHNAISTASWHLAHGRTDQALGRILSAARQLKQAVSEQAGVQ